MKTLINRLRDLKKQNKRLLSLAELSKDKEKTDFYKGELQGIEIAITYAEYRLKEQERQDQE